MIYKAIDYFTDLQDNNHEYNVGDIYPREGLKPSKERIAGLLSDDNGRGAPVIKKVEEKKASSTKKNESK